MELTIQQQDRFAMWINPSTNSVDRSPLYGFGAFVRGDKGQNAVPAIASALRVSPRPEVGPSDDGAARWLRTRSTTELFARTRHAEASRAPGPRDGFAAAVRAHSLSVQSLASAAEATSAEFDASDGIRAGTLSLVVGGRSFSVVLTEGQTLADVARAIRATGAELDVAVVSSGSGESLAIRRRSTGFDPTSPLGPAEALSVDERYTGPSGRTLGLRITREAENARVVVDGRTFVRQSNTVSDVLPGTTLRLETLGPPGTETVLPSREARNGVTDAGRSEGSSWQVRILETAEAAEVSSRPFASAATRVRPGVLGLEVDGRAFRVDVAAGDNLLDVAGRIQRSGAPVNVELRREDGAYRLAVTARATGFAPGGAPASALTVSEDSASELGETLGFATTRAARNARIEVNGTPVETRGNVVAGSIPGLVLELDPARAGGAVERIGTATSVLAQRRTSPPPDLVVDLQRRLHEHALALASELHEARERGKAARAFGPDGFGAARDARKPITDPEPPRRDEDEDEAKPVTKSAPATGATVRAALAAYAKSGTAAPTAAAR